MWESLLVMDTAVMVGYEDLKGVLHPKESCGSMILQLTRCVPGIQAYPGNPSKAPTLPWGETCL